MESLHTRAPGERLRHLDGLRGLAALNVMIGHAVISADYALYLGLPSDSHGGWDRALSGWPFILPVAGANLSVCVFLVLSGYVLAQAYGRTTLGAPALVLKRAVRLGVPICAATLASWTLLATGVVANHAVAAYSRSSWLDGLFRQRPAFGDALADALYRNLTVTVPAARSYDPSLWTMPIEFAGSLALIGAWAAVRPLRARRVREPVLGALLGAGILLAYPLYASLMLAGAALALVKFARPLEAWLERPGVAPLVAVLGLLAGTVPYGIERGPTWDAIVALAPPPFASPWPNWAGARVLFGADRWHAVGAVLLIVALDRWPSARRALEQRFPQWLGRISFPLYLVHLPILVSLGCGTFLALHRDGWSPGTAALLAGGTFAAGALAAAVAFERLVDRPAQSWASRAAVALQRFLDGVPRPRSARRAAQPTIP